MANVKGKQSRKSVKSRTAGKAKAPKPAPQQSVWGCVKELLVSVGESILSFLPRVLSIAPLGSIMVRMNPDRRWDFWRDDMAVWTLRLGRAEVQAFPKDTSHSFELQWGKVSVKIDLR